MNIHATSLKEKGINYKEGRALLSGVQTEERWTPAPRLPRSTSCASNSLFPGHSVDDILVLFIKGHFCSVGFAGWNVLWGCSRPWWAPQLCCMGRVMASGWSHAARRGHPSTHPVFLTSGFRRWSWRRHVKHSGLIWLLFHSRFHTSSKG